jgi:hypothetical protein|tara:strand:- start:24530 stop:25036 length:507 start_codon:yes stop_codon:yes gene_type:complete
MKIKHAPLYNTKKIEERYSEKDGVPVSYVCTTDLNASDNPVDIFYRETPHPKFGNRYFGLYHQNGSLWITGTDQVENYEFGMIQDAKGVWWYSQSHHDCLMIDGKMIDGGRVYVRGNGIEIFKIRNGKFVTLAEAEVSDGNDPLEMSIHERYYGNDSIPETPVEKENA